jgi:hypothetical protein
LPIADAKWKQYQGWEKEEMNKEDLTHINAK